MGEKIYIDLNSLFYQIEKLEDKYYFEIIINKTILEECVRKINDYLDSIYKENEPSEYKIGGTITFWLRKLKPFSFNIKNEDKYPDLFINENIAVIFGYSYIRYYKKKKGYSIYSLSARFLADLSIQLRYSSFSPSSIAIIYQAIYDGKTSGI